METGSNHSVKYMDKLYSTEELKNMQATGEWPVSQFSVINEKYSDRWTEAKKVMDAICRDPNVMIDAHANLEKEHENMIRIRNERYHERNYVRNHMSMIWSYDVDTYFKEPEDYSYWARRTKLYINNGSRASYELFDKKIPELEYWLDFFDDISPIMDHYATNNFPSVKDFLYRFMLIEYDYPTATEADYHEQRKFNTDSFGPDHCDETLGGFHIGENQMEFQAANTKTGDWEYIQDLDKNNTLWMFGEYGEKDGWIPTYHRMIHNPDPTFGTRYSIIVNLMPLIEGEGDD